MPKGTKPDTPGQIIEAFLMVHDVAPWEAEELLNWLKKDGFVIVPLEPSMAMEKAYKGALYQHIARLPPEERERHKNKRRGKIIDQHTKMKIRWRAMVHEAVRAFTPMIIDHRIFPKDGLST